MIHFPLHLQVAFAVLSAARIVHLLSKDRITDWLRKMIVEWGKAPSGSLKFWLAYLISCPSCLSVWSAAAATAFFYVCPWVNFVFAVSWLYIVWADSRSRKRELETERDGRVLRVVVKDGKADWTNDLTAQEIAAVFNILVASKSSAPQGEA